MKATKNGAPANPRNSACDLQASEVLKEQHERLLRMRKRPEAFIKDVFHSDDDAWVDRCQSIIRDRPGKRKDKDVE